MSYVIQGAQRLSLCCISSLAHCQFRVHWQANTREPTEWYKAVLDGGRWLQCSSKTVIE